MLQLKGLKKTFKTGELTQVALDGVSLNLRDNEFVAILGPSGSGKTTLLNMIGGLDRYDSGDLIINGISTKKYKDRDWDSYRNHTIGFVFQSYNLIPHQSILANVELALTISGVGRKERRARAKKALADVGLGDQLHKKPNQMSGGQMQRVAIARALINDPDILLADEPTGALDSETSVQVMELLKEVAKDRLVVMVTHNPELAEEYANRIVKLRDGKIIDDSNPFEIDENTLEAPKHKNMGKSSMSLFTSFGLSLRNLFTKKGRTLLTSFAGSIGIIGIALIYAVSNGLTAYINTVQEDTLSSSPITLESTHVDLGSLMISMMDVAESKEDHELDAVYSKTVMYDFVNILNSIESQKNDLKAFKEFVEREYADTESELGLNDAISGIHYGYNINLLLYTKNVDGTIIHSDTNAQISEIMGKFIGKLLSNSEDLSGMQSSSGNSMSSMMTGTMGYGGLWQEILPGDGEDMINPIVKKQYDIVEGKWPEAYNEVVLVLDSNNEIADMALYALGLISEDEIDIIVDAAINKTPLTVNTDRWSYQEILDMEFRTIFPADCYTLDERTGLYTDMRDTSAGLKYLYDNGTPLKVVGIIRPNEDAVSGMLTGSIAYTSELTKYVVEESKTSAAINAQLANPSNDIFTGLPFDLSEGNLTDAEKATLFREYVATLDTKGKAETYVKVMGIPDKAWLEGQVSTYLGTMTEEVKRNYLITSLTEQMGMDAESVTEYVNDMTVEDIDALLSEGIAQMVKEQYRKGVEAQLAAMTEEQLAGALDMSIGTYSDELAAIYYEEAITFSNSTYEFNLMTLGYVELDDPASISLYASTFANKDIIEEAIAKYNEGVDELEKIGYTDYLGILMSSIATIIDAITYVLIGFVSVSLIVSSIMIGVITLISVQERTKEIGILRAIGASKKNVSSMFNAETVIIGFASGLVGVLVTYLLCIPLNAILVYLTGIPNLTAQLPIPVAVILVIISMGLTLISGLIPSRSAAKKDPVAALRTE
ncbi:MAG: ABC transporter ATP-binding protein/permease [Clostridia bacterium]|nr:ABC transporter ATP-binding protein/permease [Clostridia bacterium]